MMIDGGEDRTAGRVTLDAVNQGQALFEHGLDHTDGYRVTVGWNDDGYWVARCSGVSTGDVIGTGMSKVDALLDLACSLAATIDAVQDPTEENK